MPRTQRLTAEFLLRVPGIIVLVDGYNVAKLGWPGLSLEQQRTNMLDAVDGLARRFGTEFVVVIDGADVVGAHADRRRLARVTYSPAGVKADDVIRAEITGLDPGRSAAVVTNDREVRRDVMAAGANIITSEAFDRHRAALTLIVPRRRPIPRSDRPGRPLYRRWRDRRPATTTPPGRPWPHRLRPSVCR